MVAPTRLIFIGMRDYATDFSVKRAKAVSLLLDLRRMRRAGGFRPAASLTRQLLGQARLCRRVIRYARAHAAAHG
jgi:hypothetical protein